MPITVEYDHEVNAVYVRLQAGVVAESIEVYDVVADKDDSGALLGFEFLGSLAGVASLPRVAERLGFLDRWREIQVAIEEALPPPTSYTGATALPTRTIVNVKSAQMPVASGSVSLGVPPRDLQTA